MNTLELLFSKYVKKLLIGWLLIKINIQILNMIMNTLCRTKNRKK